MRVDDLRPQLLDDLGLPTVVIGEALGNGPWPAVGIDDRPGIVAAVEHLVALGHRHIALTLVALVGLALWALGQFPIDPTIARIIRVVVIVVAVLYVLDALTGRHYLGRLG